MACSSIEVLWRSARRAVMASAAELLHLCERLAGYRTQEALVRRYDEGAGAHVLEAFRLGRGRDHDAYRLAGALCRCDHRLDGGLDGGRRVGGRTQRDGQVAAADE